MPNGTLAIVAIVVWVGVVVAFVRHRPKSSIGQHGLSAPPSLPSRRSNLTIETIEELVDPTARFWRLFEGDGDVARQRAQGGRFSTRSGARLSVFHAARQTVVVVADAADSLTVRRFVCHKHDGIVGRAEDRVPHPGHITEVQAKNTATHGTRTADDGTIHSLNELLVHAYRVGTW